MKNYFSRTTEIRYATDIFYLRGILKTCLIICDAKPKLGMEQGKFLHVVPVSLIVSRSM